MLPIILCGGNAVVMSSGPPTLRWNSDSWEKVCPRTVMVGPGSWLRPPRPAGGWLALAPATRSPPGSGDRRGDQADEQIRACHACLSCEVAYTTRGSRRPRLSMSSLCILMRSRQRQHRLEHRFGVAVHLHVVPTFDHLAVAADEVRRPHDAHEAAAYRDFFQSSR